MGKKNKEQEENYGFPKKWDTLLTKYSSFKDEANLLSDDDLRAKILECEVSIKEQEKSRDSDVDLKIYMIQLFQGDCDLDSTIKESTIKANI